MKIVHIAPNAPYNEGWSYQENLLPKYQHKLGHEVTLIITNTMHQDGKIVFTDCCDKMMPDGVRLIRRPISERKHRICIFPSGSPMDVYDLLLQLNPDYIFFHGLMSVSIYQVAKYKEFINPNCIIVQDNHLDYNIGRSAAGTGIRKILNKFYYRQLVKRTINCVNRVYGVTPWRKLYAEDYFGVSESKTDVLIMGADDEEMDMNHREDYRASIRKSFNISDDDFLVVSGGKLEDNKNIDVLMEACGQLQNIHLLLFGSVDKKIEDVFNNLMGKYSNIIYIGWIAAKECYKYFYAADLVCFPGRHSVLWEQACASKVPCLIKRWEGMDHVDVGGNTLFIDDVSINTLQETIYNLVYTDKYFTMLKVAQSSLTDAFLYSEIAKKSITDFA